MNGGNEKQQPEEKNTKKAYDNIINHFNIIIEKILKLKIESVDDFDKISEEDFMIFSQAVSRLFIDFESTKISNKHPYFFSENIDLNFIKIKKSYRATLAHVEKKEFSSEVRNFEFAKQKYPDKDCKKDVYNFFGIGKILNSKAINIDKKINMDYKCDPSSLPDNLELDTFLKLILTQLNHQLCINEKLSLNIRNKNPAKLQKFLDDSSKNEDKIKIKILGFSTIAPTKSKMLEWMKNDYSEELISNMINILKISKKIKILENKIIPSDIKLCKEAAETIQDDIINLIMENSNG